MVIVAVYYTMNLLGTLWLCKKQDYAVEALMVLHAILLGVVWSIGASFGYLGKDVAPPIWFLTIYGTAASVMNFAFLLESAIDRELGESNWDLFGPWRQLILLAIRRK